ncbi:MAG: hypothetical protein CL608_05490 [Anaerolineaceae bacterium]|nr:hypothetical protein [Anaerolineaceae bacterium]
MKATSPQPPPGYIHLRPLFSDWDSWDKYPQWILLIWANLMALLPLSGGVLLLWLPYQFYSYSGSQFAIWPAWTLSPGWKIAAGGLIILGSMLLHEWLHGVALKLCGYQPRYAFTKLFLFASIQKDSYLNRQQYLFMTLTPVVVMTLAGGGLLFILPPALSQLLLIALLLNTAASIGDFMVAGRVYKAPPDALFSEDHGIQLFVPASQSQSNAL